MGWVRLGQAEATTDGVIDTGSLDVRMFNLILLHDGDQSAAYNEKLDLRVGNGSIDTGNSYANRRTHNGGADSSTTDDDDIMCGYDGTEQMVVITACNRAVNDKLFIWKAVECNNNGTLAQHAPQWVFGVSKWVEDDSGSSPYNTASFDIAQLYGDNRTIRTGAGIDVFGTGEF